MYSETSYYFKNGLRCVKPYYYSYPATAKGEGVEDINKVVAEIVKGRFGGKEQKSSPASSDKSSQEEFEKDPHCTRCKTPRPDPTPKDLIMYLHALLYRGPGWEYSTPLPVWAEQDWKPE